MQSCGVPAALLQRGCRHGVFKVETIGDAYMIACGHDCSTRDHALRMAAAAVDMLTATEEISHQIGSTVQIRIGMHTGAWRAEPHISAACIARICSMYRDVFHAWHCCV